ncbi:hypothetical protein CBR_g26357 [Chara braunii]|uniref:Thioredoxin domain-containing protein n=1 Tax=Chara braunii TaxID=69332 RepID=A0A388L7P4_CHABU|nr:hypothetical protein CBR_g26357 [Chara braunii]|eukprot:GBG78329.1 hypothetical protein CBR_g26357 [Chara braunii]
MQPNYMASTEAAKNDMEIKQDGSKAAVIVDFSAQWCGPCRKIAPEFANLSKSNPNVIFVKIDVDEVQDLCTDYKVRAMPTFILLNPGSSEPAETLLGADLSKLTSMVATAAKAEPAASQK